MYALPLRRWISLTLVKLGPAHSERPQCRNGCRDPISEIPSVDSTARVNPNTSSERAHKPQLPAPDPPLFGLTQGSTPGFRLYTILPVPILYGAWLQEWSRDGTIHCTILLKVLCSY